MRLLLALLIGALPLLAEARQIESSEAVAQVMARNTQLEEAIAAGDADRIVPFFAPEFRLQGSANTILTAPQVLGQFRSGQTRFRGYDRRVETAYLAGEAVVLMGEERVQPAGSAAATQSALVTRRFTSVWRRVDGDWRQVARQSTNIAATR